MIRFCRSCVCVANRRDPFDLLFGKRIVSLAWDPRHDYQRSSCIQQLQTLKQRDLRTASLVSLIVKHPTPPAATRSTRGYVLDSVSGPPRQRQVRVSHILLSKENEAQRQDLMTRIQNGEDLATLAAEWSICPSKARGGDLGWITEGQTVLEFEKVAFGASVNTCAKADTQFGLHLLVVTDERYLTAVQRISVEEASEVIARAHMENGRIGQNSLGACSPVIIILYTFFIASRACCASSFFFFIRYGCDM